MSLAVLADHMASKGRGPDSMLIHMSPREVQGLQALAENHGGSLTINPETGLPEAGFLDKLLPTIIGAGISFFSQGAIDPMTAAAMVGGVETARTGDIGKGISAGLGAYGGANLTAGMTTAGSTAMAGEAGALAGNEAAAFGAAQLTDAGANIYSQAQLDALKRAAIDEGALQQGMSELTGKTTTGELLSKGAGVAAKDPMAYLKANAKPLMYAAGPAILAAASAKDNMPKTVTKPGMIRPYNYFGGQYVAGNPYEAAPTKSANGGLMGLADGGMTNYDDAGMSTGGMSGMFDFAQRSEPVVRMADGGILKMAAGTPPAMLSDEALYQKTGSWEAAAAERDNQNRALNIYNDAQRLSAAVAPPAAAPVNYNTLATNYVTTAAANPNITTSDFITGANTAGIGLTQPLATALDKSGLSAASQYALTHADIGSPLNAEETYGGLKGLSSNVNYVAGGLQNLIGAGKLTGQGAREQAIAEMSKYGINEADIKRATGKTLAELFPDQIKKVTQVIANQGDTTIIPGVNDYGLGGTGTSGRLESIYGPAIPPGVSGAGITTVNPNGTITTRPNIPGIPEGGFTGMTSLRKAYEDGGGSLGVNKYLFAPTTTKQIEDRYKLTGGSKQAMDYLTGKEKYNPVPYTEDGQVSKSYAESVMKLPKASSDKMYIFKNGKFEPNPDYAIPTYDSKGVKSRNVTNQNVIDYVKSPEYSNDDTFLSWMTSNNLSPEQIAAATGMSVAEIYKKIKKAKPVDKPADVVTGQNDGGGGGEANGGLMKMAQGGMSNLGDYSDGGRLLRGPGDGVSDSIPATIGNKRPARLADGEFVVPARIVSELGNGSTEAGARKLYEMMDRVQSARRGTVGKGRVAKNSRSDKYLPA